MRHLLLTALLLLPSCAYFFDKEIQKVEFVTISAEDAVCDVYVNKTRYNVHPPQAITITNNESPMLVDCKAPGNRRKKIEVPADLNATTLMNVANAGVGLPWDVASKAAFKYPDVIEIDFTGIPSTGQPLPAQNNPDIPQPEEYDLEEFSPSHPRLNIDKSETPLEVLPRRLPSYDTELEGVAGAPTAMGPPVPDDKGVLMQVIKDLRNQVDPATPKPPETAVAAPAAEPTTPAKENTGKSLPSDGADPLAPVQ